jgi:predicted kinase
MHTPGIILITGIMASGKSTVAQHLAERLPKSVHLRGDVYRRMIVNGRIEMTPDFSQEALDQLILRYRLAVTSAEMYCAAGFTVVYQDVIIGPMLGDVVEMFTGDYPLSIVVLCPSPEVVTQREVHRDKTGYGDWTPADLDTELRENTPRIGLWLDTSTLTVEATIDTILARMNEATL